MTGINREWFEVVGEWEPTLHHDRPFRLNHAWEARNEETNHFIGETIEKAKRFGVADGGPQEWHQDDKGIDVGTLLWSDVYPTEILLPNGEVVSGKPGELVVMSNKLCKHRISPHYVRNYTHTRRRFLRGVIKPYPNEEVVESMREKLRRQGFAVPTPSFTRAA